MSVIKMYLNYKKTEEEIEPFFDETVRDNSYDNSYDNISGYTEKEMDDICSGDNWKRELTEIKLVLVSLTKEINRIGNVLWKEHYHIQQIPEYILEQQRHKKREELKTKNEA
jgi:hypothetical protein